MQKIISPVLICGLVEMVSWSAVCAPYWFEGQGVILEQEVCSTTPIKIESYLITGGSKPKLFKGKKCYFFWTPCIYPSQCRLFAIRCLYVQFN